MTAWSDAIAALPAPYLWWKLDETSGTSATDSSGNGLTGTYSSATLNQTGLIPGDTGKSVTLATTSGQVSKGSGMSYPNVGVTFAQTFKSSTDFTTGRFFQGGSVTYLSWGSTNMIANVTTGQTPSLAYDPTGLCDGNAHLIVYVVRSTTVELWVDGTQVASGSHSASNTTQTAFQVKQSFANPTGSFDDVLIWSSALTSTQIGDMYAGWLGTPAAATVTLSASLPAKTAAFAAATVLAASLSASLPPKTAAFSVGTVASATLSGTLPAKTASFAAATVVDGTLSASLPAKTAAFSMSAVADTRDLALSASVPAKTAAFSMATVADMTLSGALPAKTAAFTVDVVALAAALELGASLPAKTAAFAVDVVVDEDTQDVDLSTFVDLYATTTFDGTGLTGSAKLFTFPLPFDAATAYTIEIDIEGDTDTGGALYSVIGPSEADADLSNQFTLDSATPIVGGTGTLTFDVGPGISDWDSAVTAGEHYIMFEVGPSKITAIRITPPTGEAGPAPLDAAIAGIMPTKIATFIVRAVTPVTPAPPSVVTEHAVVVAQAFGAVTMVGTQPTYTVSEAHTPRGRQQIIVDGVDFTYFRDVVTPDVTYTLLEPLLYGPGSLALPQVSACFERPGFGALTALHPGAVVEVNRVIDDEVVGTDYKGVVVAFDTSGRELTVELGGEAQGRMALRNRQAVIFPRINDLGHQMADSVRDVGVPHLPALGVVTGIETMTTGGTGHLDHFESLVAKAWTRSGGHWTVMPDEATGIYRTFQKDEETIHATAFLDDARTVGKLRRDIAEEPNRIFPTAVSPQGERIRGAVYPDLNQGPVPPFPGHMESGDTGDGVRLLLAKLQATNYLRLYEVAGGYDFDVVEAVNDLQEDAGLPQTGEVDEGTWNALYDLSVTTPSLISAHIEPMVQRGVVRQKNRSASGTVLGFNDNYDPAVLKVDRNIDMGVGLNRSQVRRFARAVLHDSNDANWVGDITFHTGALLLGDVAVGATVDEADVMDARDLRPGMNIKVVRGAAATLVHVSACQLDGDGIVTATVDTRFRDAMEVWDVIARNKESRNDPARRRNRAVRASTIQKDSVGEWDAVGGEFGHDIQLEAGWNVMEIVGAGEGTISRLRIELGTPAEFACGVLGCKTDAGFMEDVIGPPLTVDGTKNWRRHGPRARLKEQWLLYSAGTHDEPCGYGSDLKSDGADLTGVHDDYAGFGYRSESRTLLYVAVWVPEANTIPSGRIMWPQLEAGV